MSLLRLRGAQGADLTKPFQGYVELVSAHTDIDVHADATYVESIDYTYKLLDKQALDSMRQQGISYSNSLSDVQIVSAYTLKADGQKIPVPKSNYQVQTDSGEDGALPLISDIKTKMVVFPDVQVGDSIVFDIQVYSKASIVPEPIFI